MASLLHNSSRWIESVLVHASSYGGGRGGGEDDHDSDAPLTDSQWEAAPQTDNTIPSGLLPSPEKDDKITKAPLRRGRIAQVIRRGGDLGYYDALRERSNNNDGAPAEGGGAPAGKKKGGKRGRRPPPSCPPYLVLHDGDHAALAFLSPETLAACGDDVPPNKCLLTVGQFAVSTVLQCAGAGPGGLAAHSKIIRDLYNDAALISEEMEQTLQRHVNDKLFLCLYLQTPVHVIGAENQGLIGDPVDVHCSVPLRRALMEHQKAHHGDASDSVSAGHGGGELDDATAHLHAMLVDKLEAVHCMYQMDEKDRLKELRRRGGSPPKGKKYGRRRQKQTAGDYDDPPDWPWESRLDDPPGGEGGAAAVPGNVHVPVKQEEEVGISLEDVLEGAATAGDSSERDDGDRQQNVAAAQTGDGAAGGAASAPQVIRGNVAELLQTSFTGDEFQEPNDEEAKDDCNEEVGGEEKANEHDKNGEGEGTESARQIERGNVQELFDNFEDLDEVLDVESEPSSHREGASLEDERATGASQHEAGVERQPSAGATAADDGDRGASFVGINDMMVDEEEEDDDDAGDREGEEEGGSRRKGDDDDDEQPLFTQPDQFRSEDEKEEEEEEEGEEEEDLYPKSQVPLPTRKAQPTAMGESDSDDDNCVVESQVPLAMRKAPPETLGQRDDMESDSDDERAGPESQIPMPRRKKATTVERGGKNGKQGDSHHDIESQIPLGGGNQSARRPLSRRDIDSDESSEDSWMRVRSEPEQRPGAPASPVIRSNLADDESGTESPSESQMAAGEGSEESVPPRKSQRNQQSDGQNEQPLQGGSRPQERKGASTAKTSDDSPRRKRQHVRFSIEESEPGRTSEAALNELDNEEHKDDSTGPAGTRASAPSNKSRKKRKKFSMGCISQNASRMCGI